jgi:hypothetical protein
MKPSVWILDDDHTLVDVIYTPRADMAFYQLEQLIRKHTGSEAVTIEAVSSGVRTMTYQIPTPVFQSTDFQEEYMIWELSY